MVQQLDSGRWIVAEYNEMHCQWQSSDLRNPWQGYCYTFGRSLQALVNNGIKTYKHKSSAYRAAKKCRGDY